MCLIINKDDYERRLDRYNTKIEILVGSTCVCVCVKKLKIDEHCVRLEVCQRYSSVSTILHSM